MKTATTTLDIKFHAEDAIPPELLEEMINDINSYLPKTYKLSNPRESGKYIYVDVTHPVFIHNDADVLFIKGMLYGYLSGNDIEVV